MKKHHKPSKFKINIDQMGRIEVADDRSERKDFKAEYKRTSKPELLALAIGGDPTNPPQWALEECRTLYADHVRRAPTKGVGTVTTERLDQMVELEMDDPTITKHKAATKVVGAETSGDNRALVLARDGWDKELRNGRLAARFARLLLRRAGLTN